MGAFDVSFNEILVSVLLFPFLVNFFDLLLKYLSILWLQYGQSLLPFWQSTRPFSNVGLCKSYLDIDGVIFVWFKADVDEIICKELLFTLSFYVDLRFEWDCLGVPAWRFLVCETNKN